ncbi:MAG: serine hydrolase domain-containing protein, partial [Wenzhouxiangella sp.]
MNECRNSRAPGIARVLAASLILALGAWHPLQAAEIPPAERRAIVEQADSLSRLHSLLVLHRGQPVVEYVRTGPGLSVPVNIKSLSKTVLSALAGIAIERGVIEGTGQPIVELLGSRVPDGVTDEVEAITLGHALSLQTGLRSTSGRYYGAWVQSDDWVAHALTRPMVAEPGGRMIYSTGSTHLAGAALVEASDRSLLTLARDWLGEPLNIRIPDWMRDPQGIHFGGNEMLLSPRALARFGEAYRLGGVVDGHRVIPEWWIEESWTPRGRSPWSGDAYGYGWFVSELAGQRSYHGRG